MNIKQWQNWLKSHLACTDGYAEAKNLLPNDWYQSTERGDWMIWVMRKIPKYQQDKNLWVKIAIESAKLVIHLSKDAEKRPEKAIAAAEKYLAESSEENRLAAYATYATARAAYAAADATYAAAYATYAASAASAAADAAYAAADATYATARAASAAAYAASATARAASAAADAAYAAADATYAAADATYAASADIKKRLAIIIRALVPTLCVDGVVDG